MLRLLNIIIISGRYYTPVPVWIYEDLGIDLSGMSSIVVLIQGVSDGHVALTPQQNNYTDEYMYQFVFGSIYNTKVCLRRTRAGSNLVCVASSKTVLDCNEARWFWLAWHGATVQAGNGSVPGLNLMLEYTDPNPLTIRGVGVAAYNSLPIMYSTYDSYYRPSQLRLETNGWSFALVSKDSYLNDTCLERLAVSRCNVFYCASLCMLNPPCTAFNQRPATVPGSSAGGCVCELQNRVPWPVSFVPELASSYYTM